MTGHSYSLTMLEKHFHALAAAFENPEGHERAAYLFCARSVTDEETRLIVREVLPVPSEHVRESSPLHIVIVSESYVPAIAKADREGLSFVLLHSHPTGYPEFSDQDDREERELFRTAFIRAQNGPHGSVILVQGINPRLIGRVWVSETECLPLDRIRLIGRRFRVFDHGADASKLPSWADRQVRAFGPEMQALFARLHIGVVGNGGTGSAIAEELLRLGVGKITVIDEQELTDSNVTRVYGSGLGDVGTPKALLVERNAERIGLGTRVLPIQGSVCNLGVVAKLRSCDLVFCCTDDYLGRVILNRLAVWYYIPVIDMAVIIDSEQGVIREATGRVTLLLPGNACLRCRERIPQNKLQAQQLKQTSPEEYAIRVKERYAPELADPDPSVIMFTTGIAARAMAEFVQMLTGFMGDDRESTEIIERFHECEVRTNRRPGNPGCYCVTPTKWGFGDQRRFLGLGW